MGSGIFGRNYSVEDLPNYRFSSGQFLGGGDYRWNEHFSTGLFAGYQGAYANYPDGGKVWMNGAPFGVYATFDAFTPAQLSREATQTFPRDARLNLDPSTAPREVISMEAASEPS
jgi:hypothetical protein